MIPFESKKMCDGIMFFCSQSLKNSNENVDVGGSAQNIYTP